MSNRNQAIKAAFECLQANQHERAADLCRPLLAADQGDVDARFFLGVAQGALGKIPEATEHLIKVVQAQPRHMDARRELARLYQIQGKRTEAETEYRTALRMAPADAPSLTGYGQFLLEGGRTAEAAEQAKAALYVQPNLSPAHNLLAITLVDQNRMDEAIESFGRACATDPTNAGALSNLGTALATIGQFEEALAALSDALYFSPADITLHLNKASALLKSGRLLEGWSENEWRIRRPGHEILPANLRMPRLSHLGSSIQGRTAIVYHEVGFGDSLQFLRYIPLLAEAGAKVILWMPEPLVRLAQGQAGVSEVLTGEVKLPQFDFHCPLMSLPKVFETTLETIPAAVPYIKADPALVQEWAERLPKTKDKKIGLVWAGEPRPYDAGSFVQDRRRNVTLAALAPLTGLPKACFISLQTGKPADQLTESAIHNPMDAVKDFADTAAIIENLDLVVTVDTAVAHLAGAMGKPVLMLDRYDNDWRWLSGRTDSPWYPTLEIFRQEKMGEWEPVIESAAQALKKFLAKK